MERLDPWALTHTQDSMDIRDFVASEAIELDTTIKLPSSYSLGNWVYSTNYQNGYGSCTSNATSHAVQVLAVKQKGKEPTNNNIITPLWRDLWKKMGHDINDKNDSGDYVEKAVNTAYKNWITTEDGGVAKFSGYCYGNYSYDNDGIDKIKRYVYAGYPIVWCMRGNSTIWSELRQWQLKTVATANTSTGGHAICCVGWDEQGLWFLNSWLANDDKKLKSRFHVPYNVLNANRYMFNWRYRALYVDGMEKTSPEYLKNKGNALIILKALRSIYDAENADTKSAIVKLSQQLRKNYPELNNEYPIN